MIRTNVTSTLFVSALLSHPGIAHCQELIQNGSFELGNSAFGTDLLFDDEAPFTANGFYGIATNSAVWFPDWAEVFDHTTGTGQMFIATPFPEDERIWFQSVDVLEGVTYTFEGWAAHVATFGTRAILSSNVNGDSIGTLDLEDFPGATWTQFSNSWTAPSTGTVELSLTDLQISSSGNDFVLDDLSFRVVPEPYTVSLGGIGMMLIVGMRRLRMSSPGKRRRNLIVLSIGRMPAISEFAGSETATLSLAQR